MKKELDKLKDTYYPYASELDMLLVKLKIPMEDIARAKSILNRAYMNALDVGFEEGIRWQKLKTEGIKSGVVYPENETIDFARWCLLFYGNVLNVSYEEVEKFLGEWKEEQSQ